MTTLWKGYRDIPIRYTLLLPLTALGPIIFIPAFFGRIWLLAYMIGGFLLKLSKHIDFGFRWFNLRFDVKNKPLQSIGVVAGSLTALAYWFLAIVHLLTSS